MKREEATGETNDWLVIFGEHINKAYQQTRNTYKK
jgi:hypothetical protein